MKKYLPFILAVLLLLILSACTAGGEKTQNTTESQTIDAPPTAESLVVSNPKTEFEFGEDFAAEGAEVSVIYSDGHSENIDISECTVDSDYNAYKPGEYEITVSRGDLTYKYNVKVNSMKKLSLLMIGNSFSEDTVQYIYEIAHSLGIEDVNVCNMYIGGCSVYTHYQNSVKNSAAYDLQIYENGTWTHNTGKTLEEGITYADWDYISLQQASGSSGQLSTYAPLQKLMDYVREKATNPNMKFIWNMTWAYQQNSTHSDFPNYKSDQMTMYNAIVEAVQKKVATKDFFMIIPNGTAVQNARTSSVGDHLTRDGFHLSYDLGRYIAGLTIVHALTGEDISDIEYKPSGVGSKLQKIAIESAMNAVANPYEVTQSAYN